MSKSEDVSGLDDLLCKEGLSPLRPVHSLFCPLHSLGDRRLSFNGDLAASMLLSGGRSGFS